MLPQGKTYLVVGRPPANLELQTISRLDWQKPADFLCGALDQIGRGRRRQLGLAQLIVFGTDGWREPRIEGVYCRYP